MAPQFETSVECASIGGPFFWRLRTRSAPPALLEDEPSVRGDDGRPRPRRASAAAATRAAIDLAPPGSRSWRLLLEPHLCSFFAGKLDSALRHGESAKKRRKWKVRSCFHGVLHTAFSKHHGVLTFSNSCEKFRFWVSEQLLWRSRTRSQRLLRAAPTSPADGYRS